MEAKQHQHKQHAEEHDNNARTRSSLAKERMIKEDRRGRGGTHQNCKSSEAHKQLTTQSASQVRRLARPIDTSGGGAMGETFTRKGMYGDGRGEGTQTCNAPFRPSFSESMELVLPRPKRVRLNNVHISDEERQRSVTEFTLYLLRMYAEGRHMSATDLCAICWHAHRAGIDGPVSWIKLNPESSSGNFARHLRESVLKDVLPQYYHYVNISYNKKLTMGRHEKALPVIPVYESLGKDIGAAYIRRR
eukprot:5445185-Pyramimonas_sp.AAC.1